MVLKLPIRWKLTLAIGVPMVVIYSIGLYLVHERSWNFARAQLETTLRERAWHQADRMDGLFNTLGQVARSTAALLSDHPEWTQEQIYRQLESSIHQNDLIYGAAAAFEPGAFEPNRKLFSPYVHRKESGFRRVEIGAEAYDYTTWDWYQPVRESGKARWSEPYFDKGAGDIQMCTYSVPFHKDGKLRGVATIDVPLEPLQNLIADLGVQEGHFAIVSREGRFISHPVKELILTETVEGMGRKLDRPDVVKVGEQMKRGESGVIEMPNVGPEKLHGGQGIVALFFFAPIRSSGWTFAAMTPLEAAARPVREQLYFNAIMALVTMLATLVTIRIVSFRSTRPIASLAESVKRLAEGNLDTQVESYKSHDEIADLAAGFNAMIGQLRRHIDERLAETARRQSVESELAVARQIQQSLLPRVFPPYPDRPEFELHGINVPARYIAGDFFDFVFTPAGRLMVIIADVSGKGIPAAMFMAVSRTVIRNLVMQGLEPAEVFNRANRILIQDNDRGMFVTIFCALYNPATGSLTYANAGHPPPYRLLPDGSIRALGASTGTILGLIDDQTWEQAEEQLQPGESLVLFTDGVPEAKSAGQKMLTDAGFQDILKSMKDRRPAACCQEIVRAVDKYQDGHLADDVTVVSLMRILANR